MSRWGHKKLVAEFKAGNRMALAQVISSVEDQRVGFEEILHDIHRVTDRTWRVGVTGPPGAGKSTTVEKLALLFRESDRTVGVLAVDPTSPFSGGALLGDRVRMSALNLDPGVYIRSFATRGNIGGLTATTEEVLHVMEDFGFDTVIIETVGVGQSELDVASQADTTIVILVPESGDSIQILKAGLLEIADIFVVNKSDREGAEELVADIEDVLDMRTEHGAWREQIIQTTASEGKGIRDLKNALEAHRRYLESSGELETCRRRRVENRIRRIIQRRLEEVLEGELAKFEGFDALVDRVLREEDTPYYIAELILKELNLGSLHRKG